MEALLDERGLSKLRWRCRRGLLENDLFIERFFDRHAASLTVKQAEALGALMDLADNDLLDLLLRRKEPAGELAGDEVRKVLEMLRVPAAASSPVVGH
ncbi:succinate dehydrogenase assembly factor 2 [Ramlibacter sp. XY19]|uniref:FAD assembly factor SdhE n=1 Tax=Ramlibacter paludis TaxID=2908000 RepID=UPI0023DA8490|nr:succinate dehydrogenase assembly factor 2 [Ramlibacter paludis]MCG2595201.1 succinate dehydrogenase assembly factor 2 [Ramlibacter paludis]